MSEPEKIPDKMNFKVSPTVMILAEMWKVSYNSRDILD